MENFVIAGKARQVFDLIALKAKYAERARDEINNLTLDTMRKMEDKCSFNPEARCNVPKSLPCAGIDCPVYKRVVFGE